MTFMVLKDTVRLTLAKKKQKKTPKSLISLLISNQYVGLSFIFLPSDFLKKNEKII